MDRAEKRELVASLHRTFEESSLVVVTRPVGLTVAEASDLRRRMREAGAGYKVTKNRLTRLALDGTQFKVLEPLFEGPTAIAFSVDPVAAAKVCVDYANKNQKLAIVGGALGERTLDAAGIKELARLPSLDESRAAIVGLVQAPATKVAQVLQAPAGQLARLARAYADTGEAA